MDSQLKILMVDASTGYYRVQRHELGRFFGPVDAGLHLSGQHNSLNIGAGILAGSIFPGSNRLIFSGFSPCWGGFYISSMGGAALVFDNLGLNVVSIVGRASVPSALYLNRVHGEEIQVEIVPLDHARVWRSGRQGVYAVMQHLLDRFGERYESDPRILAVGPAAESSDSGAIASAPIKKGQVTFVDTWAGRGGLGSKLFQEHGLVGIIYGGTFADEDFRDRRVADAWFEQRYQQRLAAKDLQATMKYRFDPQFGTGGTFGVNYATLGGRVIAFNYRSIYWSEEDRLALHKNLIVDHYLKQFNQETIEPKHQKTCGEPCSAVCKKMRGEYKKDYEPYQTLGPLCGIFDQRAAERLNHKADTYGFDAISIGGVLAWLMDNLAEGDLPPAAFGLTDRPVFEPRGFRVEADSAHNGAIAGQLLDGLVERRGLLDLSSGARALARRLSREYGRQVLDRFVYCSFGRRGWMVPNQYWTPGVLSPMAIMGKYYMYYGNDFFPPRELGRRNAKRMTAELLLDTLGTCRFHRAWAEEMLPEVVDSLWSLKDALLRTMEITASHINSRNASVFWESKRNTDFVKTFLLRKRDVDGDHSTALENWINRFQADPREAGLDFWFEMQKGIHESLQEF